MSRLDRIIFSELWGPFIGSALLFSGLFFAGGELVRYAEFLQKGEGVLLVLRLVLYTFPMVISFTFPMAMLLSALLGFGRLSDDSEITAMMAAGISFERIMVPVAAFGILVSLVGFGINSTIVPNANRQRQALIDAAKTNGIVNLTAGSQFTIPLRDGDRMTLLHVDGGVDTVSGSLMNVSLELWDKETPYLFVYANRAKWVPGTQNWRLLDGWECYYNPRTGFVPTPFATTTTDQIHAEMASPQALAVQQNEVDQVTTVALQERAAVLRASGSLSGAREAEVEIARRIALPFGALVFALIGAPLGVRSKRGGKGVGFGLSVLITFSYWMALQVFSVLGKGGILPPYLAVAIPNLVCLGIAYSRIRRVSFSLGR